MADKVMLCILFLGIIFLIVGLIDYIKHKDNACLTGGGIMVFAYIFVKVVDKIFK